MLTKKRIAALIILSTSFHFFSQDEAIQNEPFFVSKENFVKIESIERTDETWLQYQKDLQRYQKIKNLPKNYPIEKITDKPKALFYTYTVKEDKNNYLNTFNGLYARFQTGQGSLASINRLISPQDIKVGITLIMPVPQGIFIPKKAESALEILYQKEFSSLINEKTKIYDIDGSQFYFLPDKSFSPTQISFFHDTGMQLPLSKKIVTSGFGYRTSPISGKWKFHAGIDLAAPVGTDVYACKSGTVSTVGYNSTYGNYIIILHQKRVTSLYAHLSKILVKKGQSVITGQTIGLVGTTGASTGPHLHFEVRENGNPKDPGKLIDNL